MPLPKNDLTALRPLLIGFGGPKEHGKDTLAEMIAPIIGGAVMGMSDALTEAIFELDATVDVSAAMKIRTPDAGLITGLITTSRLISLVGVTIAKRVPEVRRLYQVLGTDIVRKHQPNAWVDAARDRITQLHAAATPVLITGIRFPNELSMVRELGGSAIWVERPGHPLAAGAGHISEHALAQDDFDQVVVNGAGLSDLRSQAEALAHQLTGSLVMQA